LLVPDLETHIDNPPTSDRSRQSSDALKPEILEYLRTRNSAEGLPTTLSLLSPPSTFTSTCRPSPPLKATFPTWVFVGSKVPTGRASGAMSDKLANVRLSSGKVLKLGWRYAFADL